MIQAVAAKYGLTDSAPMRVPIATNYESVDSDLDALLPQGGHPGISDYQRLVESLLWIHRCTRPDETHPQDPRAVDIRLDPREKSGALPARHKGPAHVQG